MTTLMMGPLDPSTPRPLDPSTPRPLDHSPIYGRSGILLGEWQGYFMLSLAPTLIFALIFFVDWELASLIREADGLDKYRYNYERP
eukprot:scaffold477_cov355-Pinguiococcus_pyrenoidosus.AAC.2